MSTFSQTLHPRKGSGADTGNPGHFATTTLAEAADGTDADLDMELGFLDEEDSPAHAAFGVRTALDEDPDPYIGSMRESELHAYTQSKARSVARGYDGLDVDNLSSEVISSYLSAISNRSHTTGKDKPVSPIAYDETKARGWIVNTLKTVARREAFGTDGHDMKAWRMLSERIETEMQDTGAHPDQARVDELAEQIRVSFPPRRRPRINFHKKVQVSSLDSATEDGNEAFRTQVDQAMSAAVVNSANFEEGSVGDQLLTGLQDATGAGRQREAKNIATARVWDVMRANHEAPPIAHESLTSTQAEAHRDALQQAGGVREGISAWLRADDDHPALGPIFAPFGQTSADEKNAIIETLHQTPAYAPDLIDTALTLAARK